jgi:hypothetical protein
VPLRRREYLTGTVSQDEQEVEAMLLAGLLLLVGLALWATGHLIIH